MRIGLVGIGWLLTASGWAATIDWNATAGGDFDTASNWVGGVVPAAGDTAVFGWNPSFQAAQPINITESSVDTIQSLNIQSAVHNFTNMTFNLSGGGTLNVGDLLQSNGNPGNATLNLNNSSISGGGSNLVMGGPAGTGGTFNLINSTVVLQGAGSTFQIGGAGTGTMLLNGSALEWDSTAAAGSLQIGASGNGTLTLEGSVLNSSIKTGSIGVGVNGGSQGTLMLDGSSLAWNVGGPVVLGGAGAMSLNETGSTLAISSSTFDFAQGQSSTANLQAADGSNATFAGSAGMTIAQGQGTAAEITASGGMLGASTLSFISQGGFSIAQGQQSTVDITSSDGSDASFGAATTLSIAGGQGSTADITASGGSGLTFDGQTLVLGESGSAAVSATGSQTSVSIGGTSSTTVAQNLGSTVTVDVADGATVNLGGIVGDGGQASLTVSGGATLNGGDTTLGGAAGGSGSLTVNGVNSLWSGASLDIGPAGRGVVTVENGGTVEASMITIDTNGTLNGGGGTLQSDVTNSGTLNPGDAPGTVTITGNYTQTSTATLDEEIAGAASFDQTMIGGMANLGGILDIDLSNGFIPEVGTSFLFMQFASETGQFSQVNGLGINSQEEFSLSYDPTDVRLTVEAISAAPGPAAPEPSSAVLAVLGVAGLGLLRRRNRARGRRIR